MISKHFWPVQNLILTIASHPSLVTAGPRPNPYGKLASYTTFKTSYNVLGTLYFGLNVSLFFIIFYF